MPKSDTFAHYLNKYLSIYLPGDRGLSTNSILSYRDMFTLFLEFLREREIHPENLKMSFLTRELVVDFAGWLENSRKCSISTRNQRMGSLRAFCKWLAYENPEFLKLAEDVAEIKLKKSPKSVMNYMSADAVQCLLAQPNSSTKEGLRDLVLLALTYDTGARVSEIINVKFEDIRFSNPPIITLTGKGEKSRIVPLLPQTIGYINSYIERCGINLRESQRKYLFTNRSGEKYTRAGIKYILDKYVNVAKIAEPLKIPKKVSPHTLRHSKAMHMLQSGVNIVYIRDVLGHEHLNTTERYARADTKMKRDALGKAEIEMPDISIDNDSGSTIDFLTHSIDDDMSAWLKSFS
jgi:site-specific recombinase XerD